jgi:hypothetical protein
MEMEDLTQLKKNLRCLTLSEKHGVPLHKIQSESQNPFFFFFYRR